MEGFLAEFAKITASAAVVLAVLGWLGSKYVEYWFDRLANKREAEIKEAAEVRTETIKSQLARDLGISMDLAKVRQPAYKALWSMMETVSLSRANPLTREDRQQFDHELTSYYYNDGNALFLSIKASDLLLKAKGLLRQSSPSVSNDDIRAAFSALRTQMKLDLAVYSANDAQIQIGPPKMQSSGQNPSVSHRR